MPFRDAYKQVGESIENNQFKTDKKVHHTHEGSIGNLCTEEIALKMAAILRGFEFEKMEAAVENLVK